MQKNREELLGNYVRALNTQNWNDVAVWATELLQIDDTVPHVWANRGMALNKLGHPLDAILNFDRAMALEPTAISLSNKGACYWDMGDEKRSIKYLKEAIELEPIAQTYLTLGNIYKNQGNLEKALVQYRRCTELDPDYADGHLVLGMTLLKMGQLQEGWREYEWRWKTEQLPPRKLKCSEWKGEDLTNKTILVYGEQGLGDIIQFSRYAAQLAKQFPKAKVIVEGRKNLQKLLETSRGVYSVINAGDKLPELDYAVPMLTLAGILTPTIGSIEQTDKQFFPHPTDTENWAEKFIKFPKGIKVGLCWSGMARSDHPNAMAVDRLRSTELSTFAPLTKIPGIVWVSLQKGPPAEQVKHPPSGMTIVDLNDDLFDFYDTCCAMEQCDLVISVDTAVLHAAASIGRPTWLLSRWDGCWRWFGDREDSPWYPTLRQFVQPGPGDWAGMMQNVASELTKFVEGFDKPELDVPNDLSYLPTHKIA